MFINKERWCPLTRKGGIHNKERWCPYNKESEGPLTEAGEGANVNARKFKSLFLGHPTWEFTA